MDVGRILGGVLFVVASPLALAGGSGSVFVDAGRGPVEVELPSDFDPTRPTKLLMLLHGFGGSAQQIENYIGLGAFADAFGYLYVRPEGTLNPQGTRFWNATPACCDLFGDDPDDSTYLRDLLDEIKQVLPVDPAHVHVAGWSNGGYMAHRLACDHAEAIASIASLAGPTFDDPLACMPIDQLHVLHVHGTDDASVSYFGGFSNGAPYPGAQDTAEQWAAQWGCSLIPDTSPPPFDLDLSVTGDETTVAPYTIGCSVGGSAELWTIATGGHAPQWTTTGKTKLFEHFDDHPKPTPGASYCSATVHSGGRVARLTTIGTESIAAEDLTLWAYHAPSQTPSVFIGGTVQSLTPFGNGFLCTGPPIFRLPPPVPTSLGGDAFLPIDWTAPYAQVFTNGATLNFQLWFRDTAAGGAQFNLSQARSLTLGP